MIESSSHVTETGTCRQQIPVLLSRHTLFNLNKFIRMKRLGLLTTILTIITILFIPGGCMEKKSLEKKPIDIANMDMEANPGEDFYQYANGGWMKNNPLKEEYSRFGTFDKLAEDNRVILKQMVEDISSKNHATGSIEQKIGDYYKMGMDSARIEKLGITPLLPELDKIESISNSEELVECIARLHTFGVAPFFYLFGSPDKKNSDMEIAYLYQGGLGLTDRDYYVEDNPRAKEIREEYINHVKRIFELAGYEPETTSENAQLIMKLETRLAKSSMTLLERRDPHKTYNKMNLQLISELSPSLDWNAFFDQVGIPEPGEFNVGQPLFFKELGEIIREQPLEDIKVYLKFHLINDAAPYLSSDFVNQNFDFYGKVLSGKEEIQPRWKRVLGSTNSALGEAIGQKFVEKYFPPEAKNRMLNMVDNLKVALGKRIRELEWMGEATKKEALAKLETMSVKIGYPDKWRDYGSLKVDTASYLTNVMASRMFEFDYMVSKINQPVDKEEWHMTPQTVNAYYNPLNNEIVFPAGILQPPFFYMNADDAVNYGAIGVVIGHEMTHGFDDQGRKYDKEGNLSDWWTKKDEEKFNERSRVLVNQYNEFPVLDTIMADGELTLGENIADLGGLNISYTALQMATGDQDASQTIDGFTRDQRFFLAYSHVWAQNIRDKEILRRTKEDVHSLGKWRVNGPLRNIPEFHAAFGIKQGDFLYLDPENRATIW